jgi:hypothetical protein
MTEIVRRGAVHRGRLNHALVTYKGAAHKVRIWDIPHLMRDGAQHLETILAARGGEIKAQLKLRAMEKEHSAEKLTLLSRADYDWKTEWNNNCSKEDIDDVDSLSEAAERNPNGLPDRDADYKLMFTTYGGPHEIKFFYIKNNKIYHPDTPLDIQLFLEEMIRVNNTDV